MEKIMLALLIISTPVYANYHWKNKRVEGYELQKELIEAGCNVDHINTTGNDGTIYGPYCPDTEAVLDAHDPDVLKKIEAALDLRMVSLAGKLRSKTITVAERDELLDKMLQHMGF